MLAGPQVSSPEQRPAETGSSESQPVIEAIESPHIEESSATAATSTLRVSTSTIHVNCSSEQRNETGIVERSSPSRDSEASAANPTETNAKGQGMTEAASSKSSSD